MTQVSRLNLKAYSIAFLVMATIFLPILVSQLVTALYMPKYITSVYHFNAEYRAGVPKDEDTIIGLAVPALVEMYEKHPDWHYTLEFQGFAVERMQSLNATGFMMLRNQVIRGQCELISPLFSYQLVVAHPYNSTVRSALYNRALLEDLGFTTFSESIFFQESQTLPGFGMLNNPLFAKHGIRFRNLIGSTSTLSLYGFDVNSPIFKIKINNDPTTEFNYVTYNYLPTYQAGAFHAWSWIAPGETITGKNDWTQQGFNDMGFTPYPPNIAWHEERLSKLEQTGYHMITCDEWVDICESQGAVRPIAKFLPETVWRASDSDSIWTWMGLNTGYGNDDGSQLAEIYRVEQFALGVENLNNHNKTEIEAYETGLYTYHQQSIDKAWSHLFKAMGTDAVGWKPDYYEANYSRWHCANATILLNDVMANITDALGLMGPVQSVNFNYSIRTTDFINPINVTSSALDLTDLPVGVSIDTDDFTYSYSVSNMTYLGLNYLQLDVFADYPTSNRDVEFYLKFAPKAGGSLYPLEYSPSMMENITVSFDADNYAWQHYLPLANGFLYFDGVGIVKNCSSRHVALQTNEDDVGFYELGNNIEEMHYQLFFPIGTKTQILDFANKINVYGVVTLG